MNKKKWIIAGIAVLSVAVLGTGGYALLHKGGSSSNAVYVTQIKSLMGSYSGTNRYSGVVEAQQSVDIQADSSKKIKEIYVSTGQSVNAGDKLFAYDVTDTQNSLATSQLDIEGYTETINQLNSQIADLQAELNQTGSSDILLEIQDKQLQIKENQINIQKTQNTIEQYQDQINHSTVTATIAGVVKTINESGTDAYGNQAAFMSIEQTGAYRVKGKLDEQSIGIITQGQQVLIRSRVDETKIWTGTVSSIETSPDSNSNSMNYYGGSQESSSKYPFFISLESSDGLMLGQHVYIEPDFGQVVHTQGVWVDSSYICYDETGNAYVWASVKNKLKKISVETGEVNEETYQTEITSGITKEDYIAWPEDSFKEGMATTSIMDME